ncbi:PHP-associated domain-containing protein [Nanoarchaeota archaeon]
MLKADFHIHTKEDPEENIAYSAKELIDEASKLGFDVLSITNHCDVYFNESLKRYAKKKRILLIPGVEEKIEGQDVLILNPPKKYNLKKFEDLKKLGKTSLVIAPHPFYLFSSVGKNLIKHKDVFDAVEYCHYYLRFFNLNKKAERIAKKLKLPMVGTSDAHRLWQFNSTFSYIDAKKNISSIFEAIRKNKVKIKTKPLKLRKFLEVLFSRSLNRY